MNNLTKNITFFTIVSLFYFSNLNLIKIIFYIFITLFLYKKYIYKPIKNIEILNDKIYFDELTGLYNIKGFNRMLYEHLWDSKKYFLIIDLLVLDRINRLYSYEAGDEILKNFSLRIKLIFNHDSLVGRYENSKFLVMISGHEIYDMESYMKKTLKKLNAPCKINKNEFGIKCALGILDVSNEELVFSEIINKLHFVLNKAKINFKNFEIYDNFSSKKHIESLNMEKEIKNSLKSNEIKAYYQPQIDIKEGRISGFEALIRWEHPTLGTLAPGKFMQISKDHGLYTELLYIILENVCLDLKELIQHIDYDFRIAVNMNEEDLKESAQLLTHIKKLLKKHNLQGKYLELELTEDLAVETNKENLNFFKEIKELGIHLAIDDFGTGYSSFSHLKKFPVDKIKLDKELINDIAVNEVDERIVASIMELSKILKIDVLAEGIETDIQLEKLKNLGCNKIQGYIFGKAIPLDKLIELLDEKFYQLGIDFLTKDFEL